MGKFNDGATDAKGPPIGVDGLLRFIDDINEIRARTGNRYRFKPQMSKERDVLEMHEHLAIMRPADAKTRSPRYSGHYRIAAE